MRYALNHALWTPAEFIRLVCTRWDTLDEALRRFEWLGAEAKKPRDDRDLVAVWLLEHYGENVQKYTMIDAGGEGNSRRRRTIFWSIRPERCFPQLQPRLIDELKQTVMRTFWDQDGVPELKEVHQHYKLWEVAGDRLGVSMPLHALQCWCPTTNKEFWIIQRPWTHRVHTALKNMMQIETWRQVVGPLYRHGDILLERLPDPGQLPPPVLDDPLCMLQAET